MNQHYLKRPMYMDAVDYAVLLKMHEISSRDIGQKELVDGENLEILKYFTHTGLKVTKDETPSCAAHVGYVINKAREELNDSTIEPALKSALARDYLKYGRRCVACKGSIGVLYMGYDQYHVGILDRDWLPNDSVVYLLGSNQDGKQGGVKPSVNVTAFKSERLLDCRWPKLIT